MVTQESVRGNWNQIVNRLEQRWGELTDDDLFRTEGRVESLIDTVEQKTGESREAIVDYLGAIVDEACSSGLGHRAKEYAEEARDTLERVSEEVADSIRAGYEEAEEVAESHPFETAAVAFGVGAVGGLIVGLMIRR